MRRRVLNAPNLIALSRVPMGIAFFLWATDRPALAVGLMAAAGVSDVLDGWLARRWGLAGAGGMGAWLDPACDKFFVVACLAGLAIGRDVAPRLLLLVGARELVVVPLALLYRIVPGVRGRMRYDFRAGPPGKAATVAQFAAMAALLFGHSAGEGLAWLAAGVGLFAAADYVRRGVRRARELGSQ